MATWFGNTTSTTAIGLARSTTPFGQPFTAPVSGNITAANCRIAGGTGNVATKVVIYAVSGGAPAALLGASDELVIATSSADAVRAYTFSTPVAVVSGTSYFLMLFVGGAVNINVRYQAVSTSYYRDSTATGVYPTPINPFGTPVTIAGYQLHLEAGIDLAASTFVPRIIAVA